MKTRSKMLIVAAAVLTVAAAGGFGTAKLANRNTRSADPVIEEQSQADETDWGRTVTYDGKQYVRNEDLTTILFLGIDSERVEDPKGNVGAGGRADTIILFIMNDQDRTTRMLTVSRDTMTEVDVYKLNGDYGYSGVMQITMQYAYGDSAKRSCYLMKKTVSELLYDTPIDGTIALTVTGISKIVDKMGGLTVTFPEDYSYIDEAWTKGATVTLDGTQVERFVRYRDITVTGSNDVRMARQTWFMTEMFRQMKTNGGASLAQEILSEDPEWLETDVDAETLKNLTSYTFDEETMKVPGGTVEGMAYDEYYVDEEALQKLLISLYYVPAGQ